MNTIIRYACGIWIIAAPFEGLLAQEKNSHSQYSLSATKQFLAQLESLKTKNQWAQIVSLGEKAYEECIAQGDSGQAFLIADQLISTYFRLGEFQRARFYGDKLVQLAEKVDTPIFAVNAIYKLSSVLRGMANEAPLLEQKELFKESRKLMQKALQMLNEKCFKEQALAARVYFNTGAVEADDPLGDLEVAEDFLTRAQRLFLSFGETDYHQRTSIRLGKVFLLQGKVPQARSIINGLKTETLEKRTEMHLLYLDAQVLWEEGKLKDSLSVALKGSAIAYLLGARADAVRFETFIAAFPENINN